MSWLSNIQDKLIITLGNGEKFYPNWLNAVKTKEWNVAQFDFIDVPGTLVKRGTPKGRKFNIEIYFQGEDHLVTAQSFEDNSNDPRPWKIEHPFYGFILCQPLSLTFDNSVYNLTKITGTIAETIDDRNPQAVDDPVERVNRLHFEFGEILAEHFKIEMPKIKTSEVNKMTNNLERVNSKTKARIKLTLDFQNYFNAFSKANALVEDIVSEPLAAIRQVQAVLNAPAMFTDNVQARVNMFVDQFDLLVDSIRNIISVGDKIVFENNISSVMSGLALASVTEPDYENRNDVVEIVDIITGKYDEMLELLDGLQSDNGGNPESFIPDAGSMLALSSLINTTVSQLFNIALNSKQERVVYLDSDTNLVVLTHKYYGLDAADVNMDRIIRDNNIGLNELLQLKKDRRIVYYL